MLKMKLDKGRSEKPLIYEKGGASEREGEAQIICAEDFSPLKPLKVIKREVAACGEHAVFDAKVGIHVVKAYQKNGEFLTTIYKVQRIEKELCGELKACILVENRFAFRKWEIEPDTDKMREAISAAHKKAACIRCRAAHYYIKEE